MALLVSQYLSSRSYGHIAKIIEEQILERTGSQYEAEAHDVEQAIHSEIIPQIIAAVNRDGADRLDGDFSSLEALLARPGLLKPQSQKAFLYLCYRQQFLEHVENRTSTLHLMSRTSPPVAAVDQVDPVGWCLLNLGAGGKSNQSRSNEYRRIAESIQSPLQTSQAARTLPTHPIRLLLALLSHVCQYSARCALVPQLGRR